MIWTASTKMIDGDMTPSQCRAARALLDWTQTELAEAASLGLSTVVDFEKSRREVSADLVASIKRALEKASVQFTNGKRPGVRLKG
jgi:transcriptional regulator with XRE-family HTH domain